MDLINESVGIIPVIDRFLEVYRELVGDGWVIQFSPTGWNLVNVNAVETFDDVMFLPVSTMEQVPRSRRGQSPESRPSRSRSRSPVSLPSTSEFRSRSVSVSSDSSYISDNMDSGIRWYRMPMTPPPPSPPTPIRSPSPEPEAWEDQREIPSLLFNQEQPLLAQCTGCNICMDETVFPNVTWDCGHINCQRCVLRMELTPDCPVKCPQCRTPSYTVARID